MNKSTTNLSRVEVRDSDKGEILESFILNSDGTPYDLSGKSLVFNENKDGDKFVSDTNVTIVDAKIGHITYQLHDQVHSAPGTAWFDIIQNGTKIDSTTDFYIEVRDGLKCTVYNTTYISDLEKLKRQMEALIQQADGELKAELQKAEQQLNQELQNFRNQYNSLSADFQNQFKTAQNARQQDYNNQKNAINNDWNENKGEIWGQWNSDKASIDKQAQDTIQAIKDNAKQVLDKDQADWNAKQKQWDSTFSAIVKEWQVKTNSLNATVQDLTNKFNTIIGQVSDLMDNKLPAMDSKTDAVQAKVDELRASLGQIDWTTFARRTDNSGGVNLLANTATLKGFHNNGNSGPNTGFSIESSGPYLKDPNGNEIKTKVFHVFAQELQYAPIYFGQNFTLPPGTYSLSFLARHKGRDDEKIKLEFYTNDCANRGWSPLGVSDDISNIWEKHQIQFSITKETYEINPRLHIPTDDIVPGGSWFLANLKLEAGSIATDWCQSYLDFDRLDGRYEPVDAPDFNNLTSTGIYMITNPQKGNDYPGNGSWGILKVSNAHSDRIEQEYYEDVANGSIYHRQAVSGTWIAWQKLANIDDLSKVKIKLQSLDQNGDTFTNTQTANKQSDGSYVISTYDNDWTANKVSWLLKNTQSYNIAANTDLNDIKAPGLYHCSGTSNITNVPSGIDTWFNMVVNSDTWHGSQALYATNQNQLYLRTWTANGFKAWRRVINEGDLNSSLANKADKSNTYTKNEVNDKLSGKANVSDLANRSITSITDYDVGAERWNNTQTSKFNSSGNFANYLVDAEALKPIAHTINSLSNDNNSLRQNISDLSDRLSGFMQTQSYFQRRVDYENPTGTISDQTVDFNNYRETGILKVVNCLIQNGPYTTDNRHTLFLKITNLDGQTQYQTVYEGDNLYGRKLYNGSGQWHQYTNTPI